MKALFESLFSSAAVIPAKRLTAFESRVSATRSNVIGTRLSSAAAFTTTTSQSTTEKMATKKDLLQDWFSWVEKPMISNGPMIGAASPRLATEVSRAGGLGFHKCIVDISADCDNLKELDTELAESRRLLGEEATDSQGRLRVGAGFLGLHDSFPDFVLTALPILKVHKPCAIWLFAPATSPTPHHKPIIEAVKTQIDPPPRVFVQVGNVTAAREAIEDGADVIVSQGIDAGGHQYRKGMGVVSLVPEVKDLVKEFGKEAKIAVMAAGGIVCGQGAAAALALGADGIVMGTRFTVAEESVYPDFRKALVLETKDGGKTTLKSWFNDKIAENHKWGELYDGRAIIGPIHDKFMAGSTLEECLKELKEEYPKEEAIRLINTWAGTAVGRVNKAMPAGEIVKEVRENAIKVLKALAERY
jgi:nitronate monooxygenase